MCSPRTPLQLSPLEHIAEKIVTVYLHTFTHSSLEIRKRSKANSADPDQTPHNVASDLGLQCLLTGFSITNRIQATK